MIIDLSHRVDCRCIGRCHYRSSLWQLLVNIKRIFVYSLFLTLIWNVYHPFHISLINASNVQISIFFLSNFAFSLSRSVSHLSSSNEKCKKQSLTREKEKKSTRTTTTTTRNMQMMMIMMMMVVARVAGEQNTCVRAFGQRCGQTRLSLTNLILLLNQWTCTGMPDAEEKAVHTDIHVTRSLRIYWTRLKTWTFVHRLSIDLVCVYNRSMEQGHLSCHTSASNTHSHYFSCPSFLRWTYSPKTCVYSTTMIDRNQIRFSSSKLLIIFRSVFCLPLIDWSKHTNEAFHINYSIIEPIYHEK